MGKAREQLTRIALGLDKTSGELTKYGKALKDYISNVADGYERAADAKDELMGTTATLTNNKFDEVNALVDSYNEQRDDAPLGLSAAGDMMPAMKRVTPGTITRVKDWKAALEKQFDLEGRKQQLDATNSNLETERAQLTAEYNRLQASIQPFDPEHPDVISLRKRVRQHRAKADAYNTSLASYTSAATNLENKIAEIGGGTAIVAPTVAERPFIGTWSYSAWTFEFLPGGKGRRIDDEDGTVSSFRWKTYGTSTFKHVPDKFGGVGENRNRTWSGPCIRLWDGDNAVPFPHQANTAVLGLYRGIDEYDVLARSGFYDGRDWYTRRKK